MAGGAPSARGGGARVPTTTATGTNPRSGIGSADDARGIPVADRHVIELARMLRDVCCTDTAARLESGYEHKAKLLALSVEERDEILSVLVDCPDGLGELRAVLLQQHQWRVREGMT